MAASPRSRLAVLRISERVYRLLITLYPLDFRREYHDDLMQHFRDLSRDAYHAGGVISLVSLWGTLSIDLIQSIFEAYRRAGFSMSKVKFAQWAGWFAVFGGMFFAASSISQLQAGSLYTLYGVHQAAIYALIPGVPLIFLALVSIYLRFQPRLVLFGKIALGAAIAGMLAVMIGFSLMTLIGPDYGGVFLSGWMVYLAGWSVFAGYSLSERLFPQWNVGVVIGSAMPLAVALLMLSNQSTVSGPNWSGFMLLVMIGLGWVLAGWALIRTSPAGDSRLAQA